MEKRGRSRERKENKNYEIVQKEEKKEQNKTKNIIEKKITLQIETNI